ncbi:E3 ubiquitin-protein ligase, partial [Trichinella spiralis]
MLMIIASSRLLTGLLYWCDAIVKEFGSCNFPSDYEIILMWNVRTIDYFGFLASSSLFAWLGCVLWLAVFSVYSLVGVCILIFPELMFQMEELRPMRNRLLLNLYLIFNDDLFYASAAACMASATNNACGFAFQFYGRVPVFYNFTTIIYGAII